jgi:hypothetical protein
MTNASSVNSFNSKQSTKLQVSWCVTRSENNDANGNNRKSRAQPVRRGFEPRPAFFIFERDLRLLHTRALLGAET